MSPPPAGRAALACLTLFACQPEPAPEAPLDPPVLVEAPDEAWTATTIQGLQPAPGSHQATLASPLPVSPPIEATLATLGKVVDRHGADPENPWAVAHALLARGPDLVLTNGQPAVDFLFSTYGQVLDTPGGGRLQFPADQGDVRIEPHTDLLLKALVGAGADPARMVKVQDRELPVADLWRGSLLRSYLVPARNHSRYASPDDIAWSLQGLSGWAPPALTWVALDGTPMGLDDLTDYAAAVLYSETRFLAQAQAQGKPFQKQGQGIFQYTCGGAHLLQGVSYAVLRGFGSEDARRVVDEQIGLWFYRFPVESTIIRKALDQFPEHQDKLTVQRLKFSGHFLESMSTLAIMGAYTPNPHQQALLAEAAQEVVLATATLEQRGLLSDLPAVRKRDEQLYLDIVGDSAHAIRGLELALGRGEVRW